MKTVVSVLVVVVFSLALGLVISSCSDTKDCVCEINDTEKNIIKSSHVVSDWDGDCSKINADDIPGWSGDPCKEQ